MDSTWLILGGFAVLVYLIESNKTAAIATPSTTVAAPVPIPPPTSVVGQSGMVKLSTSSDRGSVLDPTTGTWISTYNFSRAHPQATLAWDNDSNSWWSNVIGQTSIQAQQQQPTYIDNTMNVTSLPGIGRGTYVGQQASTGIGPLLGSYYHWDGTQWVLAAMS